MINKSYLAAMMVFFVALFVYQLDIEENSQASRLETQSLHANDKKIMMEEPNIEVVKPTSKAIQASGHRSTEDRKVMIDVEKGDEIENTTSSELSQASTDGYDEARQQSLDSNKAYIAQMEGELKQAARDSNWTTLAFLADELEQKFPKHDYSFALDLAIRMNAPLYVIEGLVAKGGRFNYHHVISVAKFNRHELYVSLQALGLNVHLKTPDGKNALYYAMEGFQDKLVFIMLLIDGVDANVEYNGKRLVDVCLETLLNTKRNNDLNKDRRYWAVARSFSQLVKFGNAELLPRHLTLLNKVRETDPEIFNVMTRELTNQAELLNRLDEHQYGR